MTWESATGKRQPSAAASGSGRRKIRGFARLPTLSASDSISGSRTTVGPVSRPLDTRPCACCTTCHASWGREPSCPGPRWIRFCCVYARAPIRAGSGELRNTFTCDRLMPDAFSRLRLSVFERLSPNRGSFEPVTCCESFKPSVCVGFELESAWIGTFDSTEGEKTLTLSSIDLGVLVGPG